jgi:hypothetical protein
MKQSQPPELNSLSISDYACELFRTGTRILAGVPGTYWTRYESGAMVRIPTFHVASPDSDEVQRILWQGRVPVVSYLLSPDDRHPANAWLYICRDSSYRLEKLSKPARRDIRRAQRNLRFEPLDWPTLLANGLEAYRDTRTRVGLSDGSWTDFQDRFETFSRNPAHHAFGAWKENLLAAFMTIVVVDDWVEIQGSFSTNAHLPLCPNDGLVNYVLDHFLVRRGFQLVSYGLSSIQRDSDTAGLHSYKKKVGFESQPVHRVFTFHPLIRPFVNRFTLWSINTTLLLAPGARRLKKASGIFTHMLNQTPILKESDIKIES